MYKFSVLRALPWKTEIPLPNSLLVIATFKLRACEYKIYYNTHQLILQRHQLFSFRYAAIKRSLIIHHFFISTIVNEIYLILKILLIRACIKSIKVLKVMDRTDLAVNLKILNQNYWNRPSNRFLSLFKPVKSLDY